MWIFIVCYLLVLGLYFYTETSGKMELRAPNKIVLALMFLIYAYCHFESYQLLTFEAILLVALLFAFMGDVFLLFDFGRGGDFFLAGNLAFFAYEIIMLIVNGLEFADFWWIFLVFAVLFGGFVFAAFVFPKKLKFGKMRIPMLFYLFSIILHGCAGLGVAILLPGTSHLLLGLGSVLFMISDFLLTADKFVFDKNKWVLRANSLFYFVGMLLIALSLAV